MKHGCTEPWEQCPSLSSAHSDALRTSDHVRARLISQAKTGTAVVKRYILTEAELRAKLIPKVCYSLLVCYW